MADEQTIIDDSYISWKGELFRKGIHLTSLFIPLGFYFFNTKTVISGLIAALILSTVFDLLRIFGRESVKKSLNHLFGFIMRPREERKLSGSTTILLAALIVYLVYDLNIAAASMVIVVLGDTAAAVIGRRFGRLKIKNKTIEGSLSFIIFSCLGLLAIPDLMFRIAFIGAFIGAVIEFLPVPIDDNISVPCIAGAAMQLFVNYNVII